VSGPDEVTESSLPGVHATLAKLVFARAHDAVNTERGAFGDETSLNV
jgi:hypothetical protein